MGYASHGKCFATVQAAAADACAAYPLSWSNGTDAYTASCVGVSSAGDQLSIEQTSTATATATAQTMLVSFPPCDEMEQYADVTQVWSLCLAGLVAVLMLAGIFRRLLLNQ